MPTGSSHCNALLFRFLLRDIGADDGADHGAKTFLEFGATRRIDQLDTFALAADKPGFAQDAEMLGQRRFGQNPLLDFKKIGAVLGAFRRGKIGKNFNTNRIGEGVQNAFDRYFLNAGMKKRSHRDDYSTA